MIGNVDERNGYDSSRTADHVTDGPNSKRKYAGSCKRLRQLLHILRLQSIHLSFLPTPSELNC